MCVPRESPRHVACGVCKLGGLRGGAFRESAAGGLRCQHDSSSGVVDEAGFVFVRSRIDMHVERGGRMRAWLTHEARVESPLKRPLRST